MIISGLLNVLKGANDNQILSDYSDPGFPATLNTISRIFDESEPHGPTPLAARFGQLWL